MILSAMQLALIKGATALLLTETCTIEVEEQGTGPLGEPTHAWTVVAAGVTCRVISAGAQNSSDTTQVGDQETMRDTYRLICPAGTALAVNQRITVGEVVYHVTRLMTDRTSETDSQALIERARIS